MGSLICRYQLDTKYGADRFCWVTWEGESVVYDRLTGDTHRLAYPSGFILDHASCTIPESIEDFVCKLRSNAACVQECEKQVVISINALCDLGLLKPVPFENFQPLPN